MDYKIPLFKLNYDNREIEAVTETIKLKWISTGTKCTKLEKEFSNMIGSRYALSLTNCTSSLHLPTKSKEVYDVSGAGDTVVAAFSLALSSDTNLCDAAEFANHAAGIKVGKVGTVPVDINELKDKL